MDRLEEIKRSCIKDVDGHVAWLILEIENLRQVCQQLRDDKVLMHNVLGKEIERLRNIGNELIDKMCELCRIINPQHANCTYCDEKYSFVQALKEK